MLPFYISDETTPAVEIKAHEIMKDIIVQVLEPFLSSESYDDVDYSNFFPNTVYKERTNKCHNVIKDLYFWSRDLNTREESLSPMHAYALHSILRIANDLEESSKKDTGESLFFKGLPPYSISTEDNGEECVVLKDLSDFDFYFTYFFSDHEFLNIDNFAESIRLDLEGVVMNTTTIDFIDYLDLMPLEVERYYLEKRKFR